MNSKEWIYPKDVNQEKIRELAAALQIQTITASILLRRGLEGEAAQLFWNPQKPRFCDFRDLPGTLDAGERIARAIRTQAKIVVFGDYDVDGITASALLLEFIRARGGQVEAVLPNRFEDGYGLSEKFVESVLSNQTKLLITVDCGITAVSEIQRAKAGGLEVVVTDHHEPGLQLPPADVIVNPKVTGPEELKTLAGVGVVLMVARAVASAMEEHDHEPLRKHLDLVALGTVADVVPLLGENRYLTRAGLSVIQKGERIGLRALIHAAGIEPGKISSTDLAFRLAPRINASGRMSDAKLSLDLLLCQDADQAQKIAALLNQHNQQRQQSEQTLLQEAEKQLEQYPELPKVILVSQPDWPLGVIGLAASKLSEKYHRPAFVFSLQQHMAKGSARSIPGFPLPQALQALSSHLTRWGGHSQAAGLTLETSRLPAFQTALQEYAALQLKPENMQPVIEIDAQASLPLLNDRLVQEFKRFEPHGYQNLRPLLALEGVRLALPPRVVGERHLKLRITDQRKHTLDAIGFGLALRAPQLSIHQDLSIAGHIAENTWNGRTSLQLEIKDLRLENQT